MEITFKALNYTVTTRTGETKQILYDVSGSCRAGGLLALMGRSGAGKTSLMDILACKSRTGLLTGEIFVNGKPMDPATFKRARCYVMQEDIMLHSATVRESLMTRALLRLPLTVSRASIKECVEGLIHELGLQACADTLVGNAALGRKGISGGERRRLSVGLELVTQPAVVFLDEPTSGLDSDTALSLVRLLSRLTARNRTVVCTIHQPSSEIVACFQDLLLMANGRLCYCGPWADLVSFLNDAGLPCPMYKSPADYIVTLTADEAAVDTLAKDARRLVQAGMSHTNGLGSVSSDVQPLDVAPSIKLQPAFSHPPRSSRRDRNLLRMPSLLTAAERSGEVHSRPPAWFQGWVLAVRYFRSWIRDPVLLGSEVFQYIFFAVSLGLMYLQFSDSTSKAPFNRSSYLWFSLASVCFTPVMTAITSWDAERQLLRRETGTGAYSVGTFFIAKTAVVVPFEVLLTVMFVSISYFMVGLQAKASKFGTHLLVMTLFFIGSESVGLLFAVASPNATYATILQGTLLFYLISYSSFLLNPIPVYFSWVPKVSYVNYAYVALMKNECYGLKLREADGTTVLCNHRLPSNFDNGLTIWENIAILASIVVGTRLTAFFALRMAKHKGII